MRFCNLRWTDVLLFLAQPVVEAVISGAPCAPDFLPDKWLWHFVWPRTSIHHITSANRTAPPRPLNPPPPPHLLNSVAMTEMLCQAASSLSRRLSRNTDPFPGWMLKRRSMSVRRSMEYLKWKIWQECEEARWFWEGWPAKRRLVVWTTSGRSRHRRVSHFSDRKSGSELERRNNKSELQKPKYTLQGEASHTEDL